MGLFDTIRCEYPLPDPAHQGLTFQTKDLDSLLDEYVIDREGRLLRVRRGGVLAPSEDEKGGGVEWPVHGDLRMYEHVDHDVGCDERVEYLVRFTHGRVEWVRRLPESPRSTAGRVDAGPSAGDVAADGEPLPPRVAIRPLRPETARGRTTALPAVEGRSVSIDEYVALGPEKLELLDGHVPGEEDLLRLLLTSVGLRRAVELVGRRRWALALAPEDAGSDSDGPAPAWTPAVAPGDARAVQAGDARAVAPGDAHAAAAARGPTATIGGVVRVDAYAVVDSAVEDGVRSGWYRGWKHLEGLEPPPHAVEGIQEQLHRAVMNALCEVLRFDGE